MRFMPLRTPTPRAKKSSLLLLLPALGLGCADAGSPGDQTRSPEASPDPGSDAAAVRTSGEGGASATSTGRADGWLALFDGESLDGWRGFRQEGPPGAWRVVDGALALTGEGEGGDLITEESFDDYELALEWRVEEGGNSGIFYLVTEEANTIWEAAPEMQVLDDANHPDGQSPLTSAGSNFALHPVPRGVVRPAGEWNQARIVVRGDSVEHWLNGTLVVEYELGSEDWQRRVAESKFADLPLYGQARSGHIGLQDHGDPVWFRNVRVREPES